MFEEGQNLRLLHGEEKVFDLSLGNPLLEPPHAVLQVLSQLLREARPGRHRYMPNAGFPEVRAAIAAGLSIDTGIGFSPSEILMSNGAAGGLNVLLRAVLDPGDEVVIIAPYFAEYVFYINNSAAVVRVAKCTADFLPDLASLQAVLSSRTRVVIINTPNNPSGAVYPETSIKGVAETIQDAESRYKTEIYLISDEPYRRLVYTNERLPYLYQYQVRSALVTSYSKDLGLAGERIGYVAVNPADPTRAELVNAMIFATRALGFVNAPALMQRTVAELRNVTVDVSRYRRKRDRLYDALVRIGYQCVKPEGAFYVFPRSPIPSDHAFVELLQSKLVLTVPGSGFGTPGYFRASYSVEDRVIEGALSSFEEAFREART